jgi:hypothetical protein
VAEDTQCAAAIALSHGRDLPYRKFVRTIIGHSIADAIADSRPRAVQKRAGAFVRLLEGENAVAVRIRAVIIRQPKRSDCVTAVSIGP